MISLIRYIKDAISLYQLKRNIKYSLLKFIDRYLLFAKSIEYKV